MTVLIEMHDRASGNTFLKINEDGTVWTDPSWPADAIAAKFFETLSDYAKINFADAAKNIATRDVHNDAIHAAAAAIDKYHSNSLEFTIAGDVIKRSLTHEVMYLLK